ncbi:glycosyl hydrolase [Gracilibacillus xinjiangensis]|uniref:Glycosyl hydrolase n=1 Tax=Gracilibacillus xinjiangensis TaxID=1193282 RepID=A0ABV8WXG8_9BACI
MLNQQKFLYPSAEFGIHPFWFWNGEMEEAEIEHQINEMADKHVTGFFLCARQGMTVPYLSEEWFDKVNYAIEVAEKNGMHVWLYDEYPYPSGIAGGEVTLEHKDAKQSILTHNMKVADGGGKFSAELPWGKILFAKAVPVDHQTGHLNWEEAIDIKQYIGNIQLDHVYQKTGLTAYNQRRYFTYDPKRFLTWEVPAGQWQIHCFMEEEISDFKYYGTYVDPLHKDAIKTFIRVTHEKYLEKVGNHFGKTIKGMFTDETHLLGELPWSPQLVPYIQEHYGYDIRDHLHKLLFDDENAAMVRYQYYQSIHEMLRDVYHKQIHDWCETEGIQYVSEVPSARMSAQVYSHVPGGDSSHEKLGRSLDWILKRYFFSLRANPKMISALSNQLNRDRALIECFHSVGWSMTMQDAKWMIDRMVALGINFFNFHAFFYTLNGLVKHDAPPSQFLQNPYWEHYRLLGDYVSRISYLMSQGTVVREIAVLDPTTSLWVKMANPFMKFSYVGNDDKEKAQLEKLKNTWRDICLSLTKNHHDYDHLDPEILAQAQISEGNIVIGKARYSILILPPITNLEKSAWLKIKQFMEQGGVVIANGLLPYENIESDPAVLTEMETYFNTDSIDLLDFWQNSSDDKVLAHSQYHTYFIKQGNEECERLHEIIEQFRTNKVQFRVEDGTQSFLMQHRQYDDGSDLIFLTNQENGRHRTTLYYQAGSVEKEFLKVDIETGQVQSLPVTRSENRWELPLTFVPYQSYLIKVIDKEAKQDSIQETAGQLIILAKQKSWDLTLDQPNILRLSDFEMTIHYKENITGTVEAKTFIDQCEDLSKTCNLPVQFSQIFGTPMELSLPYPLNVSYVKLFQIEQMSSECFLLIDKNAVSDGLSIYINDKKVNWSAFNQQFFYDHTNIVADISELVKQGENSVEVKGQIEKDWDGVVDPIYLLGDFGVVYSDTVPVITKTPEKTSSLKQPYAGLPHYAGSLTFTSSFEWKGDNNETYQLRIKDLDEVHDAVEISLNGISLGVRAWSPYDTIVKGDQLKQGINVLTIKVKNTLVGLLEGKYFDYEEHVLKEVRTVKREEE